MPTWLPTVACIAGILLVAALVFPVMRSKRRLDRRIRDFKRELAERQGPPPDPWQGLAELYAAERQEREAKRKRRGR